MYRLILRIVLLTLFAGLVAGCANRPRQTEDMTRMFDIRGVAVTANGGVSGAIIGGVQRQTELAIAATTYAFPKTRGVINVHIASVTRDFAGHAQAEVSVTLSDVATGQPVLIRGYLVLASSERGRVSDAAIVDAIAMRLRYEFGMSMPPIRPVVRMDPNISTKLDTDAEPRVQPVKTIVVPLKTAPVIGADQDPILNSDTKVEPAREPAKVQPAEKALEQVPAKETVVPDASVESGARTKVVIKPKATEQAPADEEPCVETLDNKC